MKQLKKGLFALLVGVFGLLSVNAQTNLFENGDFKKGVAGWNLGRDFSLGGEASYPYIQTGYINQYGAPRVSTDGQTIAVAPGETYVFSFWADGLSEGDMSGNFQLKKADGSSINNIKGIEGVNYNVFRFNKVRDENGWTLFEREIAFPADSEVAKLTQFGISLIGSNKSYKKITEISMVKKENPAPKNFKVVDSELAQRNVEFSWDAVSGKKYKVEVGDKTYSVAEGQNMLVLYDLLPNQEYVAKVYVEDAPEYKTELNFKTADFIGKEGERVPFLANIMNNQVNSKFVCNISDLEGGAIKKIEVTFNDFPATVENGYIILPETESGKLVVTITQEDREETVLTYNSITKK